MIGKQQMPELAIAAVLVLLGLAVAQRGWAYSVGTISNIGPGFFPFWLGLLLALLGSARLGAIVFRADAVTAAGDDDGAMEAFPWRPVIVVPVAILAWIYLLKPLGLVPATAILVIMTTFAESPLRFRSVLALAVFVPAACYFLFIYLLQMPLAAIAW